MKVLAATDTSGILLRLLNEARQEADDLRARLEKTERILLSTRLIMGHEIKRPVAAICGYLDLAIERAVEAAPREVVDAIRKAREECRLLDELGALFLQILKLDGRRSTRGGTVVDVGKCLEEALERLPESLRARERVTAKIGPGTVEFRTDPDVLAVVLVNIVENALEYSDPGSPVEVSIETSADKRGGSAQNLLKIRVTDRGGGIPEELVKAIFKPFVRLHEGVSKRAGLGLTLVRSLVELQGGSVFIRSEERKGTTVYVTIPETPVTDGGAV